MKRLIFLILLLVFIISCGKKEKEEIKIMAAASLTELMEEIKTEYEKENNIKLSINLAGSQTLAFQIEQGMEADIFLSANKKYMDLLEGKKLIVKSEKFAGNKLVLAVNKEKLEINDFDDIFKTEKLKVSLADKAVPVGNYTEKMLEKLKNDTKYGEDKVNIFLSKLISKELSVKAVVAKIELGEADCGIVYSTDVNKNNEAKIKKIEIADEYNTMASYYMGITDKSIDKKSTNDFYKFFLSEKAKKIMEKYGYIIK